MTVSGMRRLVMVWGVVTVLAHLAGLGDVAGLMSFVLLGGLVGAPLAMHLGPNLRSTTATVALALALSFAITAVAAQSLIWFGLAHRILIIGVATVYALALDALLDDPEESAPGPATVTGS